MPTSCWQRLRRLGLTWPLSQVTFEEPSVQEASSRQPAACADPSRRTLAGRAPTVAPEDHRGRARGGPAGAPTWALDLIISDEYDGHPRPRQAGLGFEVL